MQAKTKRWIKRTWIVGSLALVLGAGLTVYLLQRPPAVWRAAQALLDETTDAERAELAEGVMQRLSSAAGRLGPDHDPVFGVEFKADPTKLTTMLASQSVDETFELELSQNELLSVASDWAEKWVKQRGFEMPSQMSQPIVMIQDGELMIAFELIVGSWQQVLSGRVNLRFDPDGMAQGNVTELAAGSFPLSVSTVGEWVAKQLPDSQAETADRIGLWVAELEDFEFRPVLELEHRRRARVIAMQVRKESLLITMRLQDHRTYKAHNTLMKTGSVAVNDVLRPARLDGSAIADVPTTTD